MSKSIKLKNNVYLDAQSLRNLIVYKSMNTTFSDYSSVVSNTTLGVDNCNNYVWYINPHNWEFIYYVDSVGNNYINIRCRKLNGTSNATTTLLNSGTYWVDIIGILKV